MVVNNTSHTKVQSLKYMNSLFVGNFKASFAGKGIEFQDFREYSPGDDAKYIDWARSSMEGNTIMRRYKEDKSSDILCYIDMRESFEYQYGVKKELLGNIINLLYHAAAASGEKFGGYIDSADKLEYIMPKRTPGALQNISGTSGGNHTSEHILSLKALMNPKLKRSIIFIISDSMNLEPQSFKAAGMKHDIIYIHMSSEFEDTLSQQGVSYLRGVGGNISIDLTHKDKKHEYRELRKQKKEEFSKYMRSLGIDSMFVNEASSLQGEFLKLMKKRMNFMR